jgi:hypothetical protein
VTRQLAWLRRRECKIGWRVTGEALSVGFGTAARPLVTGREVYDAWLNLCCCIVSVSLTITWRGFGRTAYARTLVCGEGRIGTGSHVIRGWIAWWCIIDILADIVRQTLVAWATTRDSVSMVVGRARHGLVGRELEDVSRSGDVVGIRAIHAVTIALF